MTKTKLKIIGVIAIIVVVSVMFTLVSILPSLTQTVFNTAYIGGAPTFTDGVSSELNAEYLMWDGQRVKIFVGRGGIPDGNFDKSQYVAPLRAAFLRALGENQVQDGSKCEVRVASIGLKVGSNYEGLPSDLYPAPKDQWFTGNLEKVKYDNMIQRITTSGGQPIFGYNDFDCVLTDPYPVIVDEVRVGDSHNVKVRLHSDMCWGIQANECMKLGACPISCDSLSGCFVTKEECTENLLECVTDEDCADGEVCTDNECQPKTQLWLPITIIIILFILITMFMFIFVSSRKKSRKR